MNILAMALDFNQLVLKTGQFVIVGSIILLIIALSITNKWKWLWKEWICTLDHKRIGIMYLLVSTIMLIRGVGDAVLMRLQQAFGSGESSGLLSSEHFQQIFTAHGTIMIFFVAMGLMFGIINLVMPLQIGSREVAFPFLNATSFWLFASGAVLINLSLVFGAEFAATGWLAYPPLSEIQFSPGPGVDYWIWSVQIAGIGSLLSGINFLVTIIKMRAPGMSMMKLPMFSWSVVGSMMLLLFSFPVLTVILALLSLDRTLGMHFFTTDAGGNAMMYVNLIWAWGHPEVYILVLPAFGIYSEIVATFSRKRLFGYPSMVAAIMAIAVFSYLVWLHHFFTMGAGANVNAFFGIMTMVIAIPTGVKVFNWLFTMYKGSIRLTSHMVWFLGFIGTFTIGGVTGVLLAVPAIDFQVHNSLFLVAHFHNMIIGGVVFGFFAGLSYWWPKIFGFKLNEKLGKLAAYLWIIGFIVAFLPLYILGFMGATRRLEHYDASLGWQGLFIVAGIGAGIIVLGVVVQIVQVITSILLRKYNQDTTGDPWDGRTLEWSIPSPTPVYNFARIPIVTTKDAFYEQKKQKYIDDRPYESIRLPKPSPFAFYIGVFSCLVGFSVIWDAPEALLVSVVGIILSILLRSSDLKPEYVLSADRVKKMDEETLVI